MNDTLKQIEVKDIHECYVCGSKEKTISDSLHCWVVEYECGCKVLGAYDDESVYLYEECKNIK